MFVHEEIKKSYFFFVSSFKESEDVNLSYKVDYSILETAFFFYVSLHVFHIVCGHINDIIFLAIIFIITHVHNFHFVSFIWTQSLYCKMEWIAFEAVNTFEKNKKQNTKNRDKISSSQ